MRDNDWMIYAYRRVQRENVALKKEIAQLQLIIDTHVKEMTV